MNNEQVLNYPVYAKVVEGTSKNSGNKFRGVQFYVMTNQGMYKSPLLFPTNLEINLIVDALKPFAGEVIPE